MPEQLEDDIAEIIPGLRCIPFFLSQAPRG
jgi:hypothetical protein